MKVLIVDDEYDIRYVVKTYCENEGYTVYEAYNGISALEVLKENLVDVIILDIMMPKMDGYTFFKEMKESYDIPTIVVSARSDEQDKLVGFELGIDDYVTKPFSPKELIARIKVIFKRMYEIEDSFTYKDLKVDFKGHNIFIKNKEIKVTLKEYELLEYLIRKGNKATSREEILEKVWGYEFYGDDRTIDTHVKMLRQNLGDYRDIIETVRGVGYKINYEK